MRKLTLLFLLTAAGWAQVAAGGVTLGGVSASAWPNGETSLATQNTDGTLGSFTHSCGAGNAIPCTSTNCNVATDSTFYPTGATGSIKFTVPSTATADAPCGLVFTYSNIPYSAYRNGVTFSWYRAIDQTALDHSRSGGSCVGFCQTKEFFARIKRGANTELSPNSTVISLNSSDGSQKISVVNDVGNYRPVCPLQSIARASNVVTATCKFPHGYTVGSCSGTINVDNVQDTAFNGTKTCTSFPSSTTIRWAQVAGDTTSTGGSAGPTEANVSVSALTWDKYEVFIEVNNAWPTGHSIVWVNGVKVREFIGPDSNGIGLKGISAATRTNGTVTATYVAAFSGATAQSVVQVGDTVTLMNFEGTPSFNGPCVVTVTNLADMSCTQSGPNETATTPAWRSNMGSMRVDSANNVLQTKVGITFGEDQGSAGNYEGSVWVALFKAATGRPYGSN